MQICRNCLASTYKIVEMCTFFPTNLHLTQVNYSSLKMNTLACYFWSIVISMNVSLTFFSSTAQMIKLKSHVCFGSLRQFSQGQENLVLKTITKTLTHWFVQTHSDFWENFWVFCDGLEIWDSNIWSRSSGPKIDQLATWPAGRQIN